MTQELSALLLVFTLLSPNSALALRAEATPEAQGGLEELQLALLDSNDPLRATANVLARQVSTAVGISPPAPLPVTAAGLEEIGRPDVPAYKRAVIFGGLGNIGRGYLAPLLAADDFDLILADVNETLIAEAEQRQSYTVTPVGTGQPAEVRNFWALNVNQTDQVAALGPQADWIFTSVGQKMIIRLTDTVYQFIRKRIEANHLATLNIVFAENLPIDQPEITALREAVLKMAQDDLTRKYIEDKVNFIGAAPAFENYVSGSVGWVGAVVHITVPPTIAAFSENPLDVSVEGGGPYLLEVDAQELRGTSFVPSGLRAVKNIRAAREKKLLIHNMGHAALAYFSSALGIADPAEGIRDQRVARLVRKAMMESAQGFQHRYPDLLTLEQLTSYVDGLLARFGNRELRDTVDRIAKDTLERKLQENDRLFGAAISAKEAGVDPTAITLAIAAALRYARVIDHLTEEQLSFVTALAQKHGLELPESDEALTETIEHFSAGLEEGALIRILIADQPQRPVVPGAIRELVQSMGLRGQVELIEEQGKAGDQRLLKQLIEKHKPTIILVFTGKSTLVDPFVVAAAKQHGVRLVIRAGAGYENLSMDRTVHDDIPFLRSHGLRESMADYTLRLIFAGLRLRAGTRSNPEEGDVSQDPELGSLFQMSPADFDEALRQAINRKRGEMTDEQRELMFGPLSRREFFELAPWLEGQRIGISGFGEIGQEVAIRLQKIRELTKGLMKVPFEIAATSPSLLNPASEEAAFVRQLGDIRIIGPEELYQTADILTIHVPSNDANKGLIRPELFEGRTKPLVLIDTARWDLMHPAMFEMELPFEVTFFGDVDFVDSKGVVDQRVLDLRAAHSKTFVVAPHIGGLTEGSAEGALRNLLGALRRVFPVLLGQTDPASIQTINKIQIVPVVPSAGWEKVNEVAFRQLVETGPMQEELGAQGYAVLDARQAAFLGVEAVGGFIVADSAKVTDAGHLIVAESGLMNAPAAEIFPWIYAEEGLNSVIDSAKGAEAQAGDLMLMKPASGISAESIAATLRERGFTDSTAPRVAVGDAGKISALPPPAFQLLAVQKGLPAVVFLNVAMRLKDETGNTYTLLLMA